MRRHQPQLTLRSFDAGEAILRTRRTTVLPAKWHSHDVLLLVYPMTHHSHSVDDKVPFAQPSVVHFHDASANPSSSSTSWRDCGKSSKDNSFKLSLVTVCFRHIRLQKSQIFTDFHLNNLNFHQIWPFFRIYIQKFTNFDPKKHKIRQILTVFVLRIIFFTNFDLKKHKFRQIFTKFDHFSPYNKNYTNIDLKNHKLWQILTWITSILTIFDYLCPYIQQLYKFWP